MRSEIIYYMSNIIALLSVVVAFIYYVSIFAFGKDGCKPLFYFSILLILYAIFMRLI